MAVEHKIRDTDSLQTLALLYLGDSARWKEIADYNKLDPPYIVTDSDMLKAFFGSGYLTIVRANYQTGTTIKAGWQFTTRENSFIGGIVKTFEVTEDTEIPAGAAISYIPVRCTVSGEFGNVIPYSITEAGQNTKDFSSIQFGAIYNEQQFTSGKNVNVKATGDILYIPTSSSEVVPEDVSKILELIGGEDLILDTEGNLVLDPSGDLATVSGIANVRQAINHRLMTELGELVLHPDYGAGTADLIGSPNLANRQKLIEISILRALSQEDRVKEPIINKLLTSKTSVFIDISYKIAISDTADRITLTLPI